MLACKIWGSWLSVCSDMIRSSSLVIHCLKHALHLQLCHSHIIAQHLSPIYLL